MPEERAGEQAAGIKAADRDPAPGQRDAPRPGRRDPSGMHTDGEERRPLMRSLISFLHGSEVLRTGFLLGSYAVVGLGSLALAYLLRFDFILPEEYQVEFFLVAVWLVPLKLLMLGTLGQFRILLTYFRLPDVNRVLVAMSIVGIIQLVLFYADPQWPTPPRSVMLGDFIFSFLGIVVFRTSLRVYRERFLSGESRQAASARKRVAIMGAGATGSALATHLLASASNPLLPVLFLDDDPAKWKRRVHGLPVMGGTDELGKVAQDYRLTGVLLAMSSAPARKVAQITEEARSLGLTTDIVPSMSHLATGRIRTTRIRPIEIEDLLGRDAAQLDCDSILALLQEKRVLVTGAGGSIGAELCSQIVGQNPSRLILLDRSEPNLFTVEQRLKRMGHNADVLPLVGDICDESRMRAILDRYEPEILFHAAAHKHVPMMESQPSEALKNNTFGTMRLVQLAKEYQVERFVMISTDKAINPTNIMGASKRLAELYLQAYARERNGGTTYMAVRFGNVLGSSGSVIPVFRQQIAEGGPVTVTHKDVTRYFMTISEAVGLVLQCAVLGEGGEIFVLDMGTPMKIVDLAEQMIRLSGYRPYEDIEIVFTGLRPGEKLFEELRHTTETHSATAHPAVMRFDPKPAPLADIEAFLEDLKATMEGAERNEVKEKVRDFLPEYTPFFE